MPKNPRPDFIADGLSFYPQLTGEADTVRSWVFGHYEPRWGRFSNRRYVHNRDWKLYGNGSFFQVSEDPEEQRPVAEEALTETGLQLKQHFQVVLDRMQ